MSLFLIHTQVSDSKKLHIALLNLYERTEQPNEAEILIKTIQKRFRESCKMWLLGIEFHLKNGNGGNARSCLERGLQALPNRKHFKFILKAGILEFKLGSPERARVVLEVWIDGWACFSWPPPRTVLRQALD